MESITENNPLPSYSLQDDHQELCPYSPIRLLGGEQTIKVKQTIKAPQTPMDSPNKTPKKASFNSAPSRFFLPPSSIHSIHPSPGHRAPAETLPSIVLNDPYLPWKQDPRYVNDSENPDCMPWLALLVFSSSELQIALNHLSGGDSIFKGTETLREAEATGERVKQTGTFAVNMTQADLELVERKGDIASPIPSLDDGKLNTKTDIIFLQPTLFNNLVTTFENGVAKPGQRTANLERYRYLAHVRLGSAKAPSNGMVASATENEDEDEEERRALGVVVSHRIGPLNESDESPAVVHLVSLEGWKDMPLVDTNTAKYVALTSLHSWTYTVLPVGSPSLSQEFVNIERSLQPLRAPDARRSKIEMEHRAEDEVKIKLEKRSKEGYTLTKFQTLAGETTMAFLRGALVPSVPNRPPTREWTVMSNSGTDLQILDLETGSVDISYSAAWDLGRAMGMRDGELIVSLARLRNQIQERGSHSDLEKETDKQRVFTSRVDSIESLIGSMKTLEGVVNNASTASKKASAHHQKAEVTMDTPLCKSLTAPSSPDFQIVLSWILSRMSLIGVPPQYLIVDPSFLPLESLRSFYVDASWIECLIDGALSLGNQVSRINDDTVRKSIKKLVTDHLEKIDPNTKCRPGIPTCGLLLRSTVVKEFPDLKVEAIAVSEDESGERGAEILRQERIGDDVLLVLCSRAPDVLSFTLQRPSRQTFTACYKITFDEFVMRYKRPYNCTAGQNLDEALVDRVCSRKEPSKEPRLFHWGRENECRFLLVEDWIKDLRAQMSSEFDVDERITSAMVGIQLGTDSVYRLSIGERKEE
ncbi:hypothetical protein GQ43DRAFT_424191 [Delitschia confertaspora ATCC 74209]|uniref:Uncharacterized protein n=1 Tax=Delitschia confertaspora ATCC 74209 TaxID=1513339 RepID=A0A9P4JJF8_9PLEO|nr:hypothetical protein GQ43DRAFT_424191 [Delitschia confertaspora ATCC 74209]